MNSRSSPECLVFSCWGDACSELTDLLFFSTRLCTTPRCTKYLETWQNRLMSLAWQTSSGRRRMKPSWMNWGPSPSWLMTDLRAGSCWSPGGGMGWWLTVHPLQICYFCCLSPRLSTGSRQMGKAWLLQLRPKTLWKWAPADTCRKTWSRIKLLMDAASVFLGL